VGGSTRRRAGRRRGRARWAPVLTRAVRRLVEPDMATATRQRWS